MVVKKIICDGHCELCQLAGYDAEGEIICIAKTGTHPAEIVTLNKGG